ncbi:MAG: hypothetical protein ACHQ4J_09200 [Candidatus Binatia bacterium]
MIARRDAANPRETGRIQDSPLRSPTPAEADCTPQSGVPFPRVWVIGILLLLCAPAHAFDLKLWPLINYHYDAAGTQSLQLLGPLFSYVRSPEQREITLRPLFSYVDGPRVADNQFSLLYPIFVSRWAPELTEYRMLGLISFTSQNARQPDEWDRRFTIFPFVFYRYSRTLGTWLSVLPFYANVRDFLGYERIQMIAFPLYLHLQEPLVQRTWLPFPFISWADGALARGFRVWPFYGWDDEGDVERFRYVMWPFYISYERHFTRPERERRLILFPFHSRIDSAAKTSRSYVGPFFTHTVDRKAHTDTWGFPWPLWVTQYDLTTGQRTGLRLAPFYEDTHLGNSHNHFILWPAYRWNTQEVDSYRHTRSDALLVLYRNIEDAQPELHHDRTLRTLFPLYRASNDDGDAALASPALLDALFPRNPTIQRLYAPLWQVYTGQRDGKQPARWSLLWDLISSDGTQLSYPVHLDWTQ